MPRFRPIGRGDLIRCLRLAGFSGPYIGGRHQFMIKGVIRLRLPGSHQGDISLDLLVRILRQAGIDRKTWEEL
ncbi:MAG: type II toxin-antitoxin system HicA family toxin [Dehalococcoidia bacterium]|nr:type II toxin-antitoxin system HicA family toxin [Dehalococcoidia bacterium]